MADLTKFLGSDWRLTYTESCAETNHHGEIENLCKLLAQQVEANELTKPAQAILLRALKHLHDNPATAKKALLQSQPKGRPVDFDAHIQRFEYARHVGQLKIDGESLYESRNSKGAFVLAAEKLFGENPTEQQIRLMRQSWDEFKHLDPPPDLWEWEWQNE